MRRVLLVAIAALISAPGLALACAVCGAGEGRSQAAFFQTTVFLSLLPLGMIGWGLTWWYRRRSWFKGEFTERDEAGER